MEGLFYTAQGQKISAQDGPIINRAFAFGDAVQCSFYVHNSQLILAEEAYFFLMASMRKMRMKIPMDYTLEFFEQVAQQHIQQSQLSQGILRLMVFRTEGQDLAKNGVDYVWEILPFETGVLALQGQWQLDIIKEININQNMLSNLQVHSPEQIYAQIYAQDNDLNDVILLNPNRRMARTTQSNILLLQGKSIRTPKTSEGAFISPLMESFLGYIHKNALADIEPTELIAFETQKAEEILLISETQGLHTVQKIRNQSFDNQRFSSWIEGWQQEMNQKKEA
jgi:branched-subunit amino acid aminotransferase/4-amino-4-deoxychorismate lyase